MDDENEAQEIENIASAGENEHCCGWYECSVELVRKGLLCSRCLEARYCSVEHQINDFKK